MIQVITAPSAEKQMYPSVFLAGGITKCRDWQNEVITVLDGKDSEDSDYLYYAGESITNSPYNMTIFNPRQEHFDITDSKASYKQILWEFERLERMDIFSMYFCESESDQPICMYELGRNIIRMQNRFPSDWEKRIIISVEAGYKRKQDVLIQTDLCAPILPVYQNADPKVHAELIRRCIRQIRTRRNTDAELFIERKEKNESTD